MKKIITVLVMVLVILDIILGLQWYDQRHLPMFKIAAIDGDVATAVVTRGDSATCDHMSTMAFLPDPYPYGQETTMLVRGGHCTDDGLVVFDLDGEGWQVGGDIQGHWKAHR